MTSSGPRSHRSLVANGIRHHVIEQGRGPLVLLIHGFPEGSYSWSPQIDALAGAGYRVVAPDVRGYGRSDAPSDVASYRMRELVADAFGLVDALGEQTAVVVGHDWGAVIAWHCALLHPERFPAVAALSVPFTPRPPAPPTELFRKRFANTFFYMLYFQEPGIAEAELDADIRRSLRLIYYAASGESPPAPGFFGKPAGAKLLDGMVDPVALPPWMTEEDLDAWAAEFARNGFRGPLNRYRNIDRDWAELADMASALVRVPALFVTGDRDPTSPLAGGEVIEAMGRLVPELRPVVVIPGGGHWIGQQRPRETNDALLGFLRELA